LQKRWLTIVALLKAKGSLGRVAVLVQINQILMQIWVETLFIQQLL